MNSIRSDVLTSLSTLLAALARVDQLELSSGALPPTPTPPAPVAPAEPAPSVQPGRELATRERSASPKSTAAEAVYRAVIGADEPLALRQVADATRLSKPALYRAVRRLLEEQRLFRGGPESSQHARYAVTQAAADAAYRRAKR